MNDISQYIEFNTSNPLIKAAMCHYQFEMIHPYEHNNGIIGRLLIYHLLRNGGLEGIRYFSISECLHRLEAEYFEKLEQTQKNGNYYAWIEFFIQSVGEAAKKGIQLLKQYESIIRSNEEKMDALGNRSEHLAAVYQYFNSNIVSGTGQASQGLNIPFNAVLRAVITLPKTWNIVSDHKGHKKPRICPRRLDASSNISIAFFFMWFPYLKVVPHWRKYIGQQNIYEHLP